MSLEDYIVVNRDGTRTRVPGEPPRIQGPMPKINLSPTLKDNPYRSRPGESD
jgi:hypothetical protein